MHSAGGIGRCGLVALVVACVSAAALGDVRVSLRASARVAMDGPVTLGQIAILQGDESAALEDVVLVPVAREGLKGHSAWFEISVERVREVLAARGVRMATLELRGSVCAVMPMGGRTVRTIEHEDEAMRAAPDLEIHAGSVGEAVGGALVRAMGVERKDIRLRFSRRDRALLEMPSAGRSVDTRIAGRGDRMSVRVTVYAGESIVRSETIRVGVEVRRLAMIAVGEIRRGQRIGDEHVRDERRWMAGSARVATEVLGRVATRTIPAGHTILAHEVEREVVIERGDLVTVTCVSGTVLIEIRNMRARKDARVGDVIELESADGHRRVMRARVSGPGRAVLDAGGGM